MKIDFLLIFLSYLLVLTACESDDSTSAGTTNNQSIDEKYSIDKDVTSETLAAAVTDCDGHSSTPLIEAKQAALSALQEDMENAIIEVFANLDIEVTSDMITTDLALGIGSKTTQINNYQWTVPIVFTQVIVNTGTETYSYNATPKITFTTVVNKLYFEMNIIPSDTYNTIGQHLGKSCTMISGFTENGNSFAYDVIVPSYELRNATTNQSIGIWGAEFYNGSYELDINFRYSILFPN